MLEKIGLDSLVGNRKLAMSLEAIKEDGKQGRSIQERVETLV